MHHLPRHSCDQLPSSRNTSHICIYSARATDLVIALEVRVTDDIVANRRPPAAASARAEVDRDFVARDDAAPAAVERQVEERCAPFILAVRHRQQIVTCFVEDQRHYPWRHVIATTGLATWHTGMQLLHAVVLIVALRLNV